jgi:hypothetical protein
MDAEYDTMDGSPNEVHSPLKGEWTHLVGKGTYA